MPCETQTGERLKSRTHVAVVVHVRLGPEHFPPLPSSSSFTLRLRVGDTLARRAAGIRDIGSSWNNIRVDFFFVSICNFGPAKLQNLFITGGLLILILDKHCFAIKSELAPTALASRCGFSVLAFHSFSPTWHSSIIQPDFMPETRNYPFRQMTYFNNNNASCLQREIAVWFRVFRLLPRMGWAINIREQATIRKRQKLFLSPWRKIQVMLFLPSYFRHFPPRRIDGRFKLCCSFVLSSETKTFKIVTTLWEIDGRVEQYCSFLPSFDTLYNELAHAFVNNALVHLSRELTPERPKLSSRQTLSEEYEATVRIFRRLRLKYFTRLHWITLMSA